MKRTLLTLCLLSTLSAPGLFAQIDEDRLIEAVQHEDVALARELIDGGADIEAKTRYGATPLFFACDKGNVELVELLLGKGADVNVVDTFYGATPLTWVSFSARESEPHREILAMLLARKPEDAASVLPMVAEMGDQELAELVVASEKADAKALTGAIEMAKGAGHKELASYLEQQLPENAEESRIVVASETLETYVGDYVSDESGSVFKVYLEEGILKTQGPGEQPPLTMDPESEVRFVLREAPEIAVEFRGARGKVEQLVVLQAEGETILKRRVTAAKTTPDEPAAPALAKLAELPRAARTAARPWPAFRGAGNRGNGDGQGAATEWDTTADKNILWKTAIPGLANSSPIIWGDKVFVTTASTEEGDESLRIGLYGDVDSIEDTAEHTWAVYALDKNSGEILWRRVATTATVAARGSASKQPRLLSVWLFAVILVCSRSSAGTPADKTNPPKGQG